MSVIKNVQISMDVQEGKKMKKKMISFILIATIFMAPIQALADSWTDFKTVDRVQIYTTTFGSFRLTVYTTDGMNYTLQKPPESADEIKLYESLLLTAFSMQREVKFFTENPGASGTLKGAQIR